MSVFDWAPGPEDSAHLWGDYDAETTLDDTYAPYRHRPRAPRTETWEDHGTCPTAGLKLYPTEDDALTGARQIKEWCRVSSRTYHPLVPVKCDFADHYHLRYA